MAKKKRYTVDEVQKMFNLKYPRGYNGETVINKSKSWDDNYRIGMVWYKNLAEIVDKLHLEE